MPSGYGTGTSNDVPARKVTIMADDTKSTTDTKPASSNASGVTSDNDVAPSVGNATPAAGSPDATKAADKDAKVAEANTPNELQATVQDGGPQEFVLTTRQTVVPAKPGMTDTVKGGRYTLANGKVVNAEGQELNDDGSIKK